MGTPAYMSPEQASGLAATSDRQTDVFSLGVMLYEILTGLNPFRGETAVESMKGVMYHEPEPPRKLNPRVSRTLSAITMKALDKDPFRRYRSAVELAEDLRRYREYFPVTAIEPTGLEKLANWSRRRPRLATTLATLAVVLVIAALATAFQASVENARVATGYGYIDEVEEQLHNMGREISALTQQRERLEPGPERNAIDSQLAELEAEFEMAEKDRMAIALAITGFTILAPEERAREIVRQSIFDDIEEHIAVGDFLPCPRRDPFCPQIPRRWQHFQLQRRRSRNPEGSPSGGRTRNREARASCAEDRRTRIRRTGRATKWNTMIPVEESWVVIWR
jgi:serine/threonine protein kinase